METCVFCYPHIDPEQCIVLENDYCLFLQLNQSKEKGQLLEGSGVIVPKAHRETAFDLTEKEWAATHSLLQEVKHYLDKRYHPQGYNIGWNVGETGGQHIFHAHFHVIPRFEDEPFAGRGIRHLFKSQENRRR